MSKQQSIIKFKGKMDGISFFQKDGEYVARKANGPSREKLLNDPRFERTRENMREFVGLALASGSLSLAFAPVKNLRDNRLRGRSAKIFRSIMVVDEGSVLGQRQILLSKQRPALKKTELNATTPLSSLLIAKVTSAHSEDRKTATITFDDLQNHMVTAPLQATHFQIVQHVAILSDVVYNAEARRYEHANETLDTLSKTTFSEYIPVKGVPPTLTLETKLDADALTDNVSVVQALGILFFKKHGTAFYPSNESKGMRIIDVF
jgi:hypothetical protein